MYPVSLSDEEYTRLKQAKELKNYTYLHSWKELHLFQRTIATKEQIKEIADWAKKKKNGIKVLLPLRLNSTT